MGNKAEKPLGIVTVHNPDSKLGETDELENLLAQLKIVI